MPYISSASYSGEIDAIRLMTIDRYQANDFKLHTVKRRYLLSKLGETSNDLDRLEFEMLDIAERKKAGLARRSDITKQNHRIDDKIEYRKQILQGLNNEDKWISKFGENKPFIESTVYFKQLKKRADSETTVEDLELGRKYTLSTIGEVTEVIHRIERMLVLSIQQNDIERKGVLLKDHDKYSHKRSKAFEHLRTLDKRITEIKK